MKEQMVSSAESVCNNIAEGRGATSQKDYRKFLDSAAKSASELCGQIDTGRAYGIIGERIAINLAGSVVCNLRMIRGLQAWSVAISRRAKTKRSPGDRRGAKRRGPT